MKRSFVREILEAINPDTVSFAGGLPDESLFPIEGIREATQKALSTTSALQYSVSGGIESLRQKIADYYTSLGVETSYEEILITTGAQTRQAPSSHLDRRGLRRPADRPYGSEISRGHAVPRIEPILEHQSR